ncbi:MurR/RpiR family transcriptional regulator [Oceanivirga salmonicida]|uniref:MurR/RpiR family transcriptional regulator n=1 Tax=Oceanivirga salmonicida TaxID=1769291 RepID=UPI000829C5B6|nr:MurR/RpiR family transcriptional regulator [Oceanivirga salmonicida]
MKYISIIDSFYPALSKQEKKIADFFKKKKQEIAIMNLQEITKKISVSEATITRFVRKLGFKGFIDFKLEVARENPNRKITIKGDYIENISKNIFNTINDTKLLIKKTNINKAIKYIENSKKMYIFGLGASGVAAEEMQNRFMRYGKIGNCVNVAHFQVMYASTITNEDLVIAISLSGETPDLLYPVSIAKKNGCKIIAITNYILSPLAKMADIVILTSGKETPLDGGSLISKISQLYVIDILATGYALKNEKKAEHAKHNIAKAIADKYKE